MGRPKLSPLEISGNESLAKLFYFSDVSYVPVIGRAEEFELARKIETLQGEIELLEKKIEKKRRWKEKLSHLKVKVATKHEEILQAQNEIFLGNLRYVIHLAKQYQYKGQEFLDLVQEGNVALLSASRRFEAQGVRLTTYSHLGILGLIRRFCDEQEDIIRLPDHVAKLRKDFWRAYYQLKVASGEEPTIQEVAKKAKMNLSDAKRVIEINGNTLSINSASFDENDPRNEDTLAFLQDKKVNLLDQVYQKQRAQAIRKVLRSLKTRERNIIKLRFGLKDGKKWTLEEVGRHFGITREAARQAQNRALNKLRDPRKKKKLAPFIGDLRETYYS